MKAVLLTDSGYLPISTISWKRAVTLLIGGKADLLETYEEEIRSPGRTMKCPAVVRLKVFVAKKRRLAKFTRRAVCIRDNSECGYCGVKLSSKEVTFDHILPLAVGGTTDFDNLITACKTCNQLKGARTPQQAGMPLLKKPHIPTFLLGIRAAYQHNDTPVQWSNWLPSVKR